MTVNPLYCSLSSWTGADDECRQCSSFLGLNQKRWCSGSCLEHWRTQHRYYLARQLALKLAKGKCNCVRLINEPRHVLCAACGACEAKILLKGDIITCDHILPRNGNTAKFSCLHHQSNLQILCSSCHTDKTKFDEQRIT